ncbi:murein biosynthesis integral membrane protein MurJ [Sporosarcina sp. FA9]|uniref:murein biosynthesis integral membrane protein MurJ n=1 Tax=Sporosarcina sp. FA9 TaxID=3413030 RepID=UPI003F659013
MNEKLSKLMKIIGAVAIINIAARLFGFLREIAISREYGTTNVADAIVTAYTIPNFIYLVVGGALTTAFISVYHSTKSEKGPFVRNAFATVIITAVLLTTVLMIFTKPLLNLVFKTLTPDEFLLVRNLFLWMMPSTIILVLSTWMSGLLNVNGMFNLSSISVLIYNFSFVAIAVLLTPLYGAQAYGIGALLSAILMGAFLFIGLRKADLYSLKPVLKMTDDVKRLWVIALPILFGGATLQFYFIIHRIVAAMLDNEGLISAVNYASKLTGFPQAIMMTAVTTVIYPLLSKKEGEGDTETIRALYKRGLQYLSVLLIPTTAIAYYFSEPIVRLIFEHGNFDNESVLMTVPIFQIFSLSMLFLAGSTYITRFYYAKGNSMTPVIFSLISVFMINIGIIFLLLDSMGASAIAYGTVISSAANFIMLALYAKWKWNLSIIK